MTLTIWVGQWNSAGTVHRTITPPTGDSEVVPTSELGTQHVDNVSGFADLADRGGLGAWFAEIGNLNFIQIQGLGPPLNIDLVGTFHDVYLWIINNVPGGDTVANQFFVNDTTMLGLFSRESDALQELQFVLSGEAFPVVTQHQYLYVDATHGGAAPTSGASPPTALGQFLRDDDFHWNAQADTAFVGAAIGAHAAQANVHHTPAGGWTKLPLWGSLTFTLECRTSTTCRLRAGAGWTRLPLTHSLGPTRECRMFTTSPAPAG